METILDKGNFTLEELLDDDEIIEECKALNSRLINFLRERPQVEQLVRYIVEEAPEDADKKRIFKFPSVSCQIFACGVDIILEALVMDEELLDLLFSFLDPNRPHSTLIARYFSQVVIPLLFQRTVPVINYIKAHQGIIKQMVDLIEIQSIVEVLIHLVFWVKNSCSNYTEGIAWLEGDVLEMVVDKFMSSESFLVHDNAGSILVAIFRYGSPALAAKVSWPSIVRRLLHNTLDESCPKSVPISSLSVCMFLLDPTRTFSTFGIGGIFEDLPPYKLYNQASSITANPEIVEAMLETLDQFLKFLDISFDESALWTPFGMLETTIWSERLQIKVVEFIATLLSVGNEAAEKELIKLGAVKRIVDRFFIYPLNAVHSAAGSVLSSWLESKSSSLVEHILRDCSLLQKILEAGKNFTLSHDPEKPTVPVEENQYRRIRSIGHLMLLSNKLIRLGNSNSEIHACLQENKEWLNWSSTSQYIPVECVIEGRSFHMNSLLYAFEDNKTNNDHLTSAPAFASPGSEGGLGDEAEWVERRETSEFESENTPGQVEKKKTKRKKKVDWFSKYGTCLKPHKPLNVLVVQNIPSKQDALLYKLDGSNAPPKPMEFPDEFNSEGRVNVLGSWDGFVALCQERHAYLFNPNIAKNGILLKITGMFKLPELKWSFKPQLFGLCYDPVDDEYIGLMCDVNSFARPALIAMCVLRFTSGTFGCKIQYGLPKLYSESRNTGTVVKGVSYWICDDFKDKLILKFDSKRVQLQTILHLSRQRLVEYLGTLDGQLTVTVYGNNETEIWTLKEGSNGNDYWIPMFVVPHNIWHASILSWVIKGVEVLIQLRCGTLLVCNVRDGKTRLLSSVLQRNIKGSDAIVFPYIPTSSSFRGCGKAVEIKQDATRRHLNFIRMKDMVDRWKSSGKVQEESNQLVLEHCHEWFNKLKTQGFTWPSKELNSYHKNLA